MAVCPNWPDAVAVLVAVGSLAWSAWSITRGNRRVRDGMEQVEKSAAELQQRIAAAYVLMSDVPRKGAEDARDGDSCTNCVPGLVSGRRR